MAFSTEELKNVQSILTLWLAVNRPEDEIRDQLDYGYTIKNQDIFLETIRPIPTDPSKKGHYPFAKIKYIGTSRLWKIYWMRGNLKWHPYDPFSETDALEDALQKIMEDSYGCFFG